MKFPENVSKVLIDCRELLEPVRTQDGEAQTQLAEPLPSLLEQVERLTDRLSTEAEPIRTVHHFACTGGTLISKCLASMPNVQLLSEVEPFSQIAASEHRFDPTNLIQLLRNGSGVTNSSLEADVFLAGLREVLQHCSHRGVRLVLRDHSHSRYCTGQDVATTPTLRVLTQSIAPVTSVVTVRHPLDSFLSLREMGWLHFKPATLDEYCKRYQQFLDDYEQVSLFKYENIVADPRAELQAMCSVLGLSFVEDFEQLFGVHRLSGDSGRSADIIAHRGRRPVPKPVEAEASESMAYATLCQRLGYS
jgi:hypothetical protein